MKCADKYGNRTSCITCKHLSGEDLDSCSECMKCNCFAKTKNFPCDKCQWISHEQTS